MNAPSPSWPFTRAASHVLVALAVHAAIAWLLWRRPLPAAPAELPSPGGATLDLAMDDEAAPVEVVAAVAERPAPTSGARSAPGPAGERALPAAEVPTGTSGDLEPGPSRVEGSSSFQPGPATVDIGVGGTNRFLPKSEGEVEAALAKDEAKQVLKHTGWARDRELGLGPEGPVLTALADGTSQSIAPVRGHALFVAIANGAGEVVSLELAETEGDRIGWNDARRIALAALAGKKLRVPSGATRIEMKIEVTSAWKLPSGQDPGTDVTLFHVPIAKGEGKDSPKMAILDPVPKITMTEVELGPGVKIPMPTIGVRLFATNADPSNIGAKARRVIHTRLVDSSAM